MKYLQASFSIEKPAQVRGCEACIYGARVRGRRAVYKHTHGEGCTAPRPASLPLVMESQSSLMKMYRGF